MSSASSPANHACEAWQGARGHGVAPTVRRTLPHDQPDRDTLLIEGPAGDGLREWGRFRGARRDSGDRCPIQSEQGLPVRDGQFRV